MLSAKSLQADGPSTSEGPLFLRHFLPLFFAADEVLAHFESLKGHDFSRAERVQNVDRLQPLRGLASSRWKLATVDANWVIFPTTLSA